MWYKIKKILQSIGEYVQMVTCMLWGSIVHPPKLSLVRNQLFEIGVMSLPVIAITGLSTGMVLAAQACTGLGPGAMNTFDT